MSAAASIARLRQIASRLIAADDPDAAWFAAGLQEYETGAPHGLTLDQAFGLVAGRGTPWWEQEAIEKRTELLRQIRARHFGRLSARKAAPRIANAALRYERGRYRLHRQFMAPPAAVDALTVDLFALLHLGPAPGAATVRAALANENDGAVSHYRPSNGLKTGETHDGDPGETDGETTERPRNDRPAAA